MDEVRKSLENRMCVQLNGSFVDNHSFVETFFDELFDRTAVSAMVNESVTKGIAKALSEEASEAISAKDVEIDNLHEKLRSYESELLRLKGILENGHVENGSVGATSSKSGRLLKESLFLMGDANHSKKNEYPQDLGVEVKKEWKGVMIIQAEEKWQKIMRGMADIRMLVSCKSVDHLNFNNSTIVSKSSSFSDSDLTFEPGITSCNLDEASASSKLRTVFNKVSKLEEELVSLRNSSDKVFQSIYDDFLLSKSTSIECQWMWKVQEAVNATVMQDFIQSIQKHSEEELRERQVIGMQHDAWLGQMGATSSLREELENISQSLFGFESGSLLLHGSNEAHDEEANGPKSIQSKVLGNRVLLVHQEHSASVVPSEESTSGINISSDAAEFALKHMTKEELISHFKAEMNKMSRNHESELHAATEKYFQLKRELPKDKGSLHTRKDKDLEGVKKRFLKVIENLDDIMNQNVKFSIIFDDYERICGQIDMLTKENESLKKVLSDRKKESRLLSSQVIDARQKLARQSTELNLLKQVREYKSELEECEMKGFIMNDIYITVLKELILGHECGVSDSDLATIILHELSELLLQETVKDADTFMKFAMESYYEVTKLRYEFESLAEERGQAISIEMQEKEQLEREKEVISASLKAREELELEAMSTLIRREKELNIVSQECDTLRHQILQHESVIMDKDHKLASMSGSLELASQQLDKYRNDVEVLQQRLKLTSDNLQEAREQRISLEHAVQENRQTAFMFLEKEREQKKQLEMLSKFVIKCSKEMKEFERKVVDTILLHNLRFWKLNDTLRPLIQQGSLFRNRGIWCKKIFSDLQKAEAEVDLLGDEVDSLLNLLEKIYFALDHYSPVLKYYPGIMEILKLVKQELCGEK